MDCLFVYSLVSHGITLCARRDKFWCSRIANLARVKPLYYASEVSFFWRFYFFTSFMYKRKGFYIIVIINLPWTWPSAC